MVTMAGRCASGSAATGGARRSFSDVLSLTTDLPWADFAIISHFSLPVLQCIHWACADRDSSLTASKGPVDYRYSTQATSCLPWYGHRPQGGLTQQLHAKKGG